MTGGYERADRDRIPSWLEQHLPERFDEQHEVVQRAQLHSLLEIPMDGDWHVRAYVIQHELYEITGNVRRPDDAERAVAAYWRQVHQRVAARSAEILHIPRRHERCRTCPEGKAS